MEYCGLDMIQLHGDESPEFCREFPSAQVIKAVELKNEADFVYAKSYHVGAILVDSRHAGLYGGTGKKANWDLACRIKNKKPLILSGGLNEKNIAEALKAVAPAALDINSGVESEPGKKDHAKLARIFDIIRHADVEPGRNHYLFKKGKMMKTQPDKYGHFGIFGGRYAAETLMPALIELEKAYRACPKR